MCIHHTRITKNNFKKVNLFGRLLARFGAMCVDERAGIRDAGSLLTHALLLKFQSLFNVKIIVYFHSTFVLYI